jgi:hypothetical protein
MAVSRSPVEDQQLDPALTAVRTAYPTPPLPPFFHPPNQAAQLWTTWRCPPRWAELGSLLVSRGRRTRSGQESW